MRPIVIFTFLGAACAPLRWETRGTDARAYAHGRLVRWRHATDRAYVDDTFWYDRQERVVRRFRDSDEPQHAGGCIRDDRTGSTICLQVPAPARREQDDRYRFDSQGRLLSRERRDWVISILGHRDRLGPVRKERTVFRYAATGEAEGLDEDAALIAELSQGRIPAVQ